MELIELQIFVESSHDSTNKLWHNSLSSTSFCISTLVMIHIIYTYILHSFNTCIHGSCTESALGKWAQIFSKCIIQWKAKKAKVSLLFSNPDKSDPSNILEVTFVARELFFVSRGSASLTHVKRFRNTWFKCLRKFEAFETDGKEEETGKTKCWWEHWATGPLTPCGRWFDWENFDKTWTYLQRHICEQTWYYRRGTGLGLPWVS